VIDRESIKFKLSYNNIFIIEDRNKWENCSLQCEKEHDLVLCIDFALKKELENQGYSVAFLDHLVDGNIMQQHNIEMHDFLHNWFRSSSGQSLLQYEGFDIGDAFLLNVLNDITYFCHFFFNLLTIRDIQHQTLFICVQERLITYILNKLNIPYTLINANQINDNPVYFYPISKWMNEKVSRASLKDKIKDTVALTVDYVFTAFDALFRSKGKLFLYIQAYHPTFGIIKELKKDKNISVLLGNYTSIKAIYNERRILFPAKSKKIDTSAIIESFNSTKKTVWCVNEVRLSDYLHDVIKPIVINNIDTAVSRAKAIKSFLKKNPIKLMVPVTDLWLTNRLIMQYCLNNNVPIFMIINGLLASDFYRDATDSDWVNCYSESIKRNYFKNVAKAIPLGDPRMDVYAAMESKKINRENPVIVIGAAGFSPIDLNSYLAYEFDFLYDILTALSAKRAQGLTNTIILKVRANGYFDLYKSFTDEYFADLDIHIEQNTSFINVIKNADLYISFYSQTILEASCIGIPAIYYKNDNQFVHAPFDCQSELVTATNIEELQNAINAFYNSDDCFDKFMDKMILEKYIGKLDGKNTRRNIDFIYSLIEQNNLPNEL
jgi:hypothetical protein